ncbi:MAG: type II toxin-antitoxin system RelE/ParE family toxin [Candidatus ainarchaeum sp.]|nr:type II toxin-antitoxin system RelE/ParE family toxin [Candidatus ainarchaeum sp.]
MFEVRFSNKAEKFLKKCDGKIRARLNELFLKLGQNPVPAKEFDLRKIAGETDTYRIRLSRYRATYCVYWEQKIIRVLKIERRKENTYKNI